MLQHGDRVEIQWNLHKHCYSIKACDGPKKGRVVQYVWSFNLSDAKFVVRPAGREKVRKEGRKNVHAFVRGYWNKELEYSSKIPVTYNPYKNDTFVSRLDASPITFSKKVCGWTCFEQSKPVMYAVPTNQGETNGT